MLYRSRFGLSSSFTCFSLSSVFSLRAVQPTHDIHFATLMALCHLKKAELEKSSKSTKDEWCEEVMLRRTIPGTELHAWSKVLQRHI